MADLGYITLVIAFMMAVYAAMASFVGGWKKIPELVASARNCAYVVCGLITIAAGILLYSFLTHDFSIRYVAAYSSRNMSLIYTMAAFYGGNAGSLLFWSLFLSISGAIVVLHNRTKNQALMPYVIAIIMASLAFFLLLMVFLGETNPFARGLYVPPDGNGLNPLLQNPGMLFHPPTLLWGYAGFTIPFAFAMAALITRKLDNEWVVSIRRWTLVAWIMLTLGNLIGAQWAYVELGWGGYWAWDPVENASFMPWLVGTAFLHSIMIQRRRGMLKVWNMILIITTFCLSIFGTFIVRSGAIQSVHSFGVSALGPFFLAFLILTLGGSLWLLFSRLGNLKGEDELDSFVSRESSFLANNVILVAATFAIFLGSVFPIISEWVKGNKMSVGPGFFNEVTMPIFLLLIFLMGICPLIGWRKASVNNLMRNFIYPLGAGILVAVVLAFLGKGSWLAIVGFSACAFVLASICLEWFRGTRARHRTSGENYPRSFLKLLFSNRPRYGGYVVHIGVILIAVGIIGSHAFASEKTVSLTPGQQESVTSAMTGTTYTLKYEGKSEYPTSAKNVQAATLELYNSGEYKGTMTAQNYSNANNPDESATVVAIRTNMVEDVYVILMGFGDNQLASFKFLVNPLVLWIWIGGGVLIVGTAFAFWPERTSKKKETIA